MPQRQFIDIESRKPYVLVMWQKRCSYAIVVAQNDTTRVFALVASNGQRTGETYADHYDRHTHIKSAAFNVDRCRMEAV